jgi:UDP-N-acetylglucosamine--N-acetylmuramyl-(pentapeptide) pyrophosphoryl-undecaprenol N-acetylglucosamine transferase
MYRVVLTGGGTAGHIWPLVAVAEALKNNKRVNIKYIGSFSGMEKEIARKNNLAFTGILVGKKRAYFSFMNFIDLFKIIFGLIQTYFILLFYQPNAVMAKGGYVSFPVIFWAKHFKIPLVIHESDILMGKSNKYAAKYAQKICIGFPLQYFKDIPLNKVVYTGTPVRKEFYTSNAEQSNLPTILITGGSQGAQIINETIEQILPQLTEKYQVIFYVGEKNLDHYKDKQLKNLKIIGFSENIADDMKKADLIISRAGANTLAEISALKKASILIPYAAASNDHQAVNAKVYADAQAAIVISEKYLTSESLLAIINQLMSDSKLLKILGDHAHQFAREDSVGEIVDIIFEVIK